MVSSRKIFISLILFLALFSFSVSAEIKIQKAVLLNGMTVLLEENHALPIVTTAIFYKVGLRDETGKDSGKAHFVEHMMFKGTDRYKKGEIARVINKLGGRLEAFTTPDYTTFSFDLPSRYLETGWEIEANRMTNCRFDSAEVEAERKVIMEEKKMSLDNPKEKLEEETMRQSFGLHPYRKTILGTLDNLKNLKRQELVDFYHTFYQPNNAILVVVGDVKSSEALASIRKIFGSIPRGPELPKVKVAEPELKKGKRFMVKGQVSYPTIQISYKAPPLDSKESYSLQVLDSILTEGQSSRLYKKLVREQSLFNWVDSGYYETIDPFIYSILGEVSAKTKPAIAEAALFSEISRLKNQLPDQREVEKAQNQLEADFIFERELDSDQARRLGAAEILYGYENIQKYIAKIRAVTPQDIQAVAKKYFMKEKQVVGWLLPETR